MDGPAPHPRSVPSAVRRADLVIVSKRLIGQSILLLGQVRAEQLRRWSDPAFFPYRLIAGGTDRLTEENIRERIRAKLASGDLRSERGMLLKGVPSIALCASCGLLIATNPSGYEYPDGNCHWFHVSCAALWEEERKANGTHS